MRQVKTLATVLAVTIPLAALLLLITGASGTGFRTAPEIAGNSAISKAASKAD